MVLLKCGPQTSSKTICELLTSSQNHLGTQPAKQTLWLKISGDGTQQPPPGDSDSMLVFNNYHLYRHENEQKYKGRTNLVFPTKTYLHHGLCSSQNIHFQDPDKL